MKYDHNQLKALRSLPLDQKVFVTKQRIREWAEHWGEDKIVVSFSGGKDSTVLLHIVRELYPKTKAAFIDTGLEYPEIREFVRKFDNVEWLKPKLDFRSVIDKYGYPMISKEVSECIAGAKQFALDYHKNHKNSAGEGVYQTLLPISKIVWRWILPTTRPIRTGTITRFASF